MKRGEKLGILGGNGLGKSTFLKTIVGKIPALSGEYRFGTNVQIGYFDQQMAMYTSNKTVLDDFGMSIRILQKPRPEMHLEPSFFRGGRVQERKYALRRRKGQTGAL